MVAYPLRIQQQESSSHDTADGVVAVRCAGVCAVLGQCAAANCSLSVEPASAVVEASGLMADVTWSK